MSLRRKISQWLVYLAMRVESPVWVLAVMEDFYWDSDELSREAKAHKHLNKALRELQ